jgi:hypothetical protein
LSGYHITSHNNTDKVGNKNQYIVAFSMENGDVIELRASGRYSDFGLVRYSNNFRDSYGMMGNFLTGKFLLRNGTDFGYPGRSAFFRFGQDWQVRPNEPYLFAETRQPQFPQECTKPQTNGQFWFAESTARQHCIAANALPQLLDVCTIDVFLTGDPNLAILYDGRAR